MACTHAAHVHASRSPHALTCGLLAGYNGCPGARLGRPGGPFGLIWGWCDLVHGWSTPPLSLTRKPERGCCAMRSGHANRHSVKAPEVSRALCISPTLLHVCCQDPVLSPCPGGENELLALLRAWQVPADEDTSPLVVQSAWDVREVLWTAAAFLQGMDWARLPHPRMHPVLLLPPFQGCYCPSRPASRACLHCTSLALPS